jgi:hypothetical protein
MPTKKLPTMPKVKVDWAYVDVKGAGRKRLNKIIGERNAPVRHRVPVTLKGFLDDISSGDDGVSQEFSITVTGARFGKPSVFLRPLRSIVQSICGKSR